MTHRLKTIQPYFDNIASGAKTFEIRKNDRGFEVGDELLLMEWSPEAGYKETAEQCLRRMERERKF